jgi:hypothetical protein
MQVHAQAHRKKSAPVSLIQFLINSPVRSPPAPPAKTQRKTMRHFNPNLRTEGCIRHALPVAERSALSLQPIRTRA